MLGSCTTDNPLLLWGMADAPVVSSPLSPVAQGGNVTHGLPRGVRPNGPGYQARVKVPRRGWVTIGTWRLLEEAIAAREKAIERVKVEGYDWFPLPRPTKPRVSGDAAPNPYPLVRALLRCH